MYETLTICYVSLSPLEIRIEVNICPEHAFADSSKNIFVSLTLNLQILHVVQVEIQVSKQTVFIAFQRVRES